MGRSVPMMGGNQMKKIAALLALALCLMVAGTAMAQTEVTISATTIPASGSDGNEYMIRINPEGSSLPEEDIIKYIRSKFGNAEFKFMRFDAIALKDGDQVYVPTEVGSLTKEFDASFFYEDGIQQFIAFYYSYTDGKIHDYAAGPIAGGKKVKVEFNHLTPVVFAWVPGIPPVAAPLEAPDMPSTGDSSSLPGLFILLGMSVAAMGAMKLRRREN